MKTLKVVALAVTALVALSACSHKDDAQTSSNSNSPATTTDTQAQASVQQVALKQNTGSGDVLSSTNLAFGKQGVNAQPKSYFENYDETFVRNFASMPNVDQVALARIVLPDFWKENNAFKQQDIIKANAEKLKALSWGKDGLIAITVDNGASLKLSDVATGTYTIDFLVPTQMVSNAGVSFNFGHQNIAREYRFETDGSNGNNRLAQVVKKVGQDKAREIEDVVGGARDQAGSLQVPVTFYVRMKQGVSNVTPQQSYAYIVVDVDHADVAWGNVQGVKPLVALSHDDLYPAQAKGKGGTPSAWY
ncbi:hypothetical protein [Paraburkholderia ferrariae]|uniref:hypothetical protein n=1 Tax=Paraburkholderia ferrariae TaxID=386056 RepID=UPI0012EBB6C9|nr:hypothetical protein [Paraburkholderia ferrariae]